MRLLKLVFCQLMPKQMFRFRNFIVAGNVAVGTGRLVAGVARRLAVEHPEGDVNTTDLLHMVFVGKGLGQKNLSFIVLLERLDGIVHFRDIGHDDSVHDVTYENCQARERTQVLMDIANRVGGLVIGTGDMSELALGWATYNGDHMSMYGVNVGVPKTLVRHLVGHYADTCNQKA